MALPFAKVALVGIGGATTVSGAYLIFKPDSDTEDKTFSSFYNSMRDSIIPEDDRKELTQMGLQIQEGIKDTQTRFSHAALWLLEKENYKTIFKEISDVVNLKENWSENVNKLSVKLKELVAEVKKDKTESERVGLSEDKIVARALSADLENMNSKLESLRGKCWNSGNSPKDRDCNLEELYLPVQELLKSWGGDSKNSETRTKST